MSRAPVTPVTPGLSITARAQSEQGEPHARKGGTRCNQGDALSLAIPDELVERIAGRVAELLAERERPGAPELLMVDEAAELLRCKRQRVYDLLSQGRLPHLKDGLRVLIRRADLLAHLDQGMSTRNTTKERETRNA